MSSMTLEQKKVYAEQAALDLGVGKLTAEQWVEVLNQPDKASINKILTSLHQVTRVDVTPHLALLNTVQLSTDRDAKVRDLKQRIARIMNDIAGMNGRVQGFVRDAVTANKELELLESSAAHKRLLGDEIKDVLADGFYTFERYDKDNKCVYLITEPIVLKHKTQHVDLKVPMGQYQVGIETTTSAIWVNRYKNNLNEGGCPHPHVDSGGDVCFGNMYDEIARLQIDQKYGRMLQILRGILTTYNPDSPYRSLARFNEELAPPAPYDVHQWGDVRVQQFGEKVIAVPRSRIRQEFVKNILYANASNYVVRAFRILNNATNDRVAYTPYLYETINGYAAYDTAAQTNPADYYLSREVDEQYRWEGYVPRTKPQATPPPLPGERRITWSEYGNLSTEELQQLPTHQGPGQVLVIPPQGTGMAAYTAPEVASSASIWSGTYVAST